jgi:hypothetical protein
MARPATNPTEAAIANALKAQKALDQALLAVELAAERRETEQQSMAGLMEAADALVNDMMAARNGDSWSLALAYLLQYAIGHLATGDTPTRSAMAANLHNLVAALEQAFPQGRGTVGDLRRAVSPYQAGVAHAVLSEPHPYVDTLARQVLTVRDSGYRLATFREFYAPGANGLHVVRPA